MIHRSERPRIDANALMRHIFGDEPGLIAIFTARRSGSKLNERDTRFFPYPGRLDRAIEHAFAESDAGREAYFCAHLLNEERRVKENAAPALALWGDLDGCPVPNGKLAPTAVVESSSDHYHLYWRLTEAIEPETAERLNERLTHAIGADKSGFDLTQLLRIPGTMNRKHNELVELRSISDHTYTPDELDELLPELPAKPAPAPAPVSIAPATFSPVNLQGKAREVFDGLHPKLGDNGIDRSATLVKIGRVVYEAGADRAQTIDAVRERDAALYQKYTHRADAEQRYAEIVHELERNGRNTRARLVPDSDGSTAGGEPQARSRYALTDTGNSARFIDQHGKQVRWCPVLKRWLVFDGKRWATDEQNMVLELAIKTARSIYHDAAEEPDTSKQQEIARWAKRSQSKVLITAMLDLSKRRQLYVGMDDLDRDPWLLNCQNGTINLKTGMIRPHDPADLITKIVPVAYDPAATCPRFDAFLAETLVHEDVIEFIKRFTGYSLTGSTRERALVMLWGRGKNGKSTLVELIQEMLGDYGTNTDVETILMQHYRGVGNDVAALKGARFVSTAEVEKGRQLAESKLKALTGSDTVTARFLYGEPFSFRPELKLWISTNNKPVIEGTDDAVWDRVRLVPFTQRFEGTKADPELPAKLRQELAGILAWAVRGCLDWQQHGLEEPEAVIAAGQEYREESDVLVAFFEDRCVIRPGATAQVSSLYEQYRKWSFTAGEDPATQRLFNSWLRERGFTNRKITRGHFKGYKEWTGIGLLVDDGGPDNGGGGGGGGDLPGRWTNVRPPHGRSSTVRPPQESGLNIGNTQDSSRAVDDGGRKNNNLGSHVSREGEFVETSSTSSTCPPRAPAEPVENVEHQDDTREIGWIE